MRRFAVLLLALLAGCASTAVDLAAERARARCLGACRVDHDLCLGNPAVMCAFTCSHRQWDCRSACPAPPPRPPVTHYGDIRKVFDR